MVWSPSIDKVTFADREYILLDKRKQGFRANTAGGLGKAGNIPLAHLKMTLVQKWFSMKIFNGYRSTLSGTFKDLPAYFYNQHNNLHKNSSFPLACLCTSLKKLQPVYQHLQSDCAAQNINITQQNKFGRTPDNVPKPTGTSGRHFFTKQVLFLSLSRCTYKTSSKASKKINLYI